MQKTISIKNIVATTLQKAPQPATRCTPQTTTNQTTTGDGWHSTRRQQLHHLRRQALQVSGQPVGPHRAGAAVLGPEAPGEGGAAQWRGGQGRQASPQGANRDTHRAATKSGGRQAPVVMQCPSHALSHPVTSWSHPSHAQSRPSHVPVTPQSRPSHAPVTSSVLARQHRGRGWAEGWDGVPRRRRGRRPPAPLRCPLWWGSATTSCPREGRRNSGGAFWGDLVPAQRMQTPGAFGSAVPGGGRPDRFLLEKNHFRAWHQGSTFDRP